MKTSERSGFTKCALCAFTKSLSCPTDPEGCKLPVPSLVPHQPLCYRGRCLLGHLLHPWHTDRTGGRCLLTLGLAYLEGSGWVDGHMCLLPHVAPIATEGPHLGVDGSLVPYTNQQVQGACKRETGLWHAGLAPGTALGSASIHCCKPQLAQGQPAEP